MFVHPCSLTIIWKLLCLYQRIDGFGARKASSNQASCLGTHESIHLKPCRIPFSNIGKNDLLCAGLLLEMYQRRSQASQHTLPICRVLPICETRPKYSLYDPGHAFDHVLGGHLSLDLISRFFTAMSGRTPLSRPLGGFTAISPRGTRPPKTRSYACLGLGTLCWRLC